MSFAGGSSMPALQGEKAMARMESAPLCWATQRKVPLQAALKVALHHYILYIIYVCMYIYFCIYTYVYIIYIYIYAY